MQDVTPVAAETKIGNSYGWFHNAAFITNWKKSPDRR
jgi:hypothetical protein